MSKLAALLKTEKSYRRSHFVWGSLILQQWFWQSTDSSLHREKVGKIIIHERIGRFSIIKLFLSRKGVRIYGLQIAVSYC